MKKQYNFFSDEAWNTKKNENGKCAICKATTTRKDKEGIWVDAACEERFLKEKKAEVYSYVK